MQLTPFQTELIRTRVESKFKRMNTDIRNICWDFCIKIFENDYNTFFGNSPISINAIGSYIRMAYGFENVLVETKCENKIVDGKETGDQYYLLTFSF